MGSNSRTLKSPKLILSLKVGVVYLLACVYPVRSEARMSLLRFLKKGSGSVLPSPGGPLSRHMPSLSIASANKEVKSVLDAPNSAGRGKYSVYTVRR